MPAHQFDLAPQSSREFEQPESYLQRKQKVCLHIDLRLLRPPILALMAFHFKTAHFRPALVILLPSQALTNPDPTTCFKYAATALKMKPRIDC
jgi:hypothetical protein